MCFELRTFNASCAFQGLGTQKCQKALKLVRAALFLRFAPFWVPEYSLSWTYLPSHHWTQVLVCRPSARPRCKPDHSISLSRKSWESVLLAHAHLIWRTHTLLFIVIQLTHGSLLKCGNSHVFLNLGCKEALYQLPKKSCHDITIPTLGIVTSRRVLV